MSAPDGLPPLRDVIRALGLTARKSLGQNFILDLNLTRRIARAAGPLQGRSVIEVGPGPGGLTRALFLEGAERVIAMYHDQALIPLKTLGFDEGVNITLGLPFVRTSPDHGTAFDIAAEGRASARSLIEALKMASEIAAAHAMTAPS